jgi:hypothetical protein
LLDDFAARESTESRAAYLRRQWPFWFGGALGTASIVAFFRWPYDGFHYALWIATPVVAVFVFWFYFYGDTPGEHLDQRELLKIRREQADAESST